MLKFVIIVSCAAAIVLGASIDDGGPRHPHSIGQDTPVTSKRQEPVFCEVCKLVIGWIESQLTANATEKEIEQFLENDVCDNLPFPQFKDACKQFVEGDLSTLIKALVNKEDPTTVCTQVKACSQKVTRKIRASLPCELCELLIQGIENGLAKNATEQKIEKDLEDLCSLLPGSLADTCKSLVQQYTPQLIQMLINKEDPKTVCEQVGLCQED